MSRTRKRGPSPSSSQPASRRIPSLRIAAAVAAKGTSKGTGKGNRTAKPQDSQGRQSGPQRSQVTAPSPPDQSISDAAEALVGDTTLQDNPKKTAVTKATSCNRKSNATSQELSESSDDHGPFSNLKDVQYVPSKHQIQQQQWSSYLCAEEHQLADPLWCKANGLPLDGYPDDDDSDGKCCILSSLLLSFFVAFHFRRRFFFYNTLI